MTWYDTVIAHVTKIAAADHNLMTAYIRSHAADHKSAGIQPIKLDELASPTDIVTLDVSIAAHGLCPKLPNDIAKFLSGDGTWRTVSVTADVTGPASAVDGNVTVFDGITGKKIKDGLVALSSLVLTGDSRLSDPRTPTAHALSHGTGQSDAVTIAESQVTDLITHLGLKAPISSPTFTDTPAAPTAPNGTATTQLATTAFVQNTIAYLDPLLYKGVIECSGNPNYPAADAGNTYIVSVSGKIGGASGKVALVGDMLICNHDGSPAGDEATVGTYWNIITVNTGAVIGPASSTDGDILLFDGTTGKIAKDSGKTIVTTLGSDDLTIPTSKSVKTVTDTKQIYHGFVNRTSSTLTWTDSTPDRTLTITGTYTYYYQGSLVTVSTPKAVQIPNVAGLYAIYFDAAGALTQGTSFPSYKTVVPVCYVYWNGSTGFIREERHGYDSNVEWHTWAHNTIGCRYGTGLSFSFAGVGGSATYATLAGVIWDEDIQFVVPASADFVPTAHAGRIWYQNGAATLLFDSAVSTIPFKWNSGTSRVQFVDSTNAYSLTDLAANRYCNIWVYVTPDKNVNSSGNGTCISFMMETIAGNVGYISASAARSAPIQDLSAMGVSPEIKIIYRLVVDGSGQIQTLVAADDLRNVSYGVAGGTSAISAAAVLFAPTGSISSTNVQAAIEELDIGFETSATNIKMDGVQSLGSSGLLANSDHVHPVDTSRAAASAIPSAVSGDVITGTGTGIQDSGVLLSALAPKASPALTGTPTAPTGTVGAVTTQIATEEFVGRSLPNRNAIINGDCRVNQRGTAYTLVKDAYSWDSDNLTGPDRHEGMATGTAVSAGTFGQSTSSLAGTSGYGFHFSGVTLTGTGIIYQRGRIEAKDAARFKNQTASFSCKVYQDTGGAVNFTIYIRKANSADNFAAVTAIGNSGAVSIPDSTDTALKYEAISMGDCSAGIEYEIKGEVGAITTKNVYISEIQLEIGSVATAFENRSYATEYRLCRRYAYMLGNSGAAMVPPTFGVRLGTKQCTFALHFPESMRISPTMSTSTPSWINSAPSGNQIAAYDVATPGWVTITGALTIPYDTTSQDSSLVNFLAGTSFSGTANNILFIEFGSTAYLLFTAEL
jgi:hypothetical protein